MNYTSCCSYPPINLLRPVIKNRNLAFLPLILLILPFVCQGIWKFCESFSRTLPLPLTLPEDWIYVMVPLLQDLMQVEHAHFVLFDPLDNHFDYIIVIISLNSSFVSCSDTLASSATPADWPRNEGFQSQLNFTFSKKYIY